MADYMKELEAAVAAVRHASKLCQRVQLGLQASEKVDKQDDSPVTIADYGAQAVVAWSLQRDLPGVPFSMVAEEDAADLRADAGAPMLARITELVNQVVRDAGGEQLSREQVLELVDSGAAPGGAQGRHWVLDPIDGTRGFVGGRQYAVCLGLLDAGQVVVGVLGCPNLPQARITDADGAEGAAARGGADGVGTLFAARRGAGAAAGPLWADGLPTQRIAAPDTADFSTARFMESYESRHSDRDFTARLAEALGITAPPLRMDSQAKYGALARGDAAVFMRFPPSSYREKIWDHAAGALIVTEAGACISDAAGAPLDFGRSRWLDLHRGIIAAPPTLHAALLRTLADMPN